MHARWFLNKKLQCQKHATLRTLSKSLLFFANLNFKSNILHQENWTTKTRETKRISRDLSSTKNEMRLHTPSNTTVLAIGDLFWIKLGSQSWLTLAMEEQATNAKFNGDRWKFINQHPSHIMAEVDQAFIDGYWWAKFATRRLGALRFVWQLIYIQSVMSWCVLNQAHQSAWWPISIKFSRLSPSWWDAQKEQSMWPLLLLNLVKLQAAPNGEFHPREETAKLWTQTVCEETPENSKNAEE